ncbi:hypothetical protein [Nitrosomonas marina]|uniref:hypothetical protein n=1 Tax=Nitrosomonas marina TaxID=917 RepID=UPI0015A6476B|nr:hypothetical protein [Nitrosomonas marina]
MRENVWKKTEKVFRSDLHFGDADQASKQSEPWRLFPNPLQAMPENLKETYDIDFELS